MSETVNAAKIGQEIRKGIADLDERLREAGERIQLLEGQVLSANDTARHYEAIARRLEADYTATLKRAMEAEEKVNILEEVARGKFDPLLSQALEELKTMPRESLLVILEAAREVLRASGMNDLQIRAMMLAAREAKA